MIGQKFRFNANHRDNQFRGVPQPDMFSHGTLVTELALRPGDEGKYRWLTDIASLVGMGRPVRVQDELTGKTKAVSINCLEPINA